MTYQEPGEYIHTDTDKYVIRIFNIYGRYPFTLTLTNIWGISKGKSSPGITPGIFLLIVPRLITVALNFLEG